ncbi:hypothetical protein [Lentzea aerocolonigenes]|uniref:hypothetical protein n=1 Tax=Lentzea aerocolonigenes TaxID=68170 RepID=UPI0004C34554|nr:hypothetical protein [Lentzea aerocolonigenes]MCP2243500.1 hypothetical protein [Lentzea aerocolonigenes]
MSGCDAPRKADLLARSDDTDEWLEALPRCGWWLHFAPDRSNPLYIGAVFRWPALYCTADVVIIMGMEVAWYYRVILDRPDADPFDPHTLVYSSGYEPPTAIIREALSVPSPDALDAPMKAGPATEDEQVIAARLRRKPVVVVPPQRRQFGTGL